MELVNTGRRVQNPLQHKGFRRFQSCRHRPQQTRKCQVRTRLEISAEAGNFVPLILLDIPQHRKSQNRIFFAFSPVFSPTNFRAIFWKKARMKIDTESCPSGRRCSTRNAVDRKVSRVRIPNSPPQKACNHADYRLFYFCPKDKPARSSVFRGENQKFSPAPIDPQRLLKSPPSGRASPVSIACAEVILDL